MEGRPDRESNIPPQANRLLDLELSGLSRSLLIPLVGRAVESRRPDALFRDPLAVDSVDRLAGDLASFHKDWVALAAVAVRTELLDRAVRRFVTSRPGARVVNLGAGLCTRSTRIDDGTREWIDVDLPAVIGLRKQLFGEVPRSSTLAASVLDEDWLDGVEPAPGRPTLLVAEGLLIYFTEAEVQKLVVGLARRLPGAELLFEAFSPLEVWLDSWSYSLRAAGVRVQWGLRSARNLESWSPAIRCLGESFYLDHHPQRWRWLAYLRWLPPVRRLMRIVHVRFERAI